MKTSIKLFALTLLTGAMTALAVQGGEIPSRGPIPFTALDSDGNGVITEQEFNQAHAERMQTRAAQGRPMRNCNRSPNFTRFDRNGDGVLSETELDGGRQARWIERSYRGRGPGKGIYMGRNMPPSFAQFDRNHDGVLVEDEFNQGRAQRISERTRQGYLMRNLHNARPFSDIDQDGDGKVSPQEFSTAQALHRQQRFQ